jgi:hypothetical protein
MMSKREAMRESGRITLLRLAVLIEDLDSRT